MKSGRVFSIEEFSIYDGPGIRTTVFLKGCPLRCVWCHSPEGQSFEQEFLRSPNGCLHCGACLNVGKESTGTPKLVKESIAACPRGLIREAGIDYTSEELIQKLSKLIPILNRNGGGITFSGGEPLAQSEFLKECLILLNGKTNRAIQTSGFCQSERFDTILEHCDYVLYDLKLMDAKKHLRYCGVENAVILQNYQILAKSGKQFVTRLPLIPTVNDTEENLRATADFLLQNNVSYLEILPYHALTGSKYALCDRIYAPPFDQNVKPDPHLEIFKSYNIEVNIL